MNQCIEYFLSDRSPAEVIYQEQPLHVLSKEVKTTTLNSTEIFTKPPEASENVFNANNTPSARNELLAREVCRFIFLLIILLIMDA